MKYKLIALDIDGTIFDSGRVVSKANLEAIREARAAGVTVTLATGRGYLGSRPVVEELNVTGPMANYGGAIISDAETGAVLAKEDIDWKLAKTLMEYALERDIYCHIYQGDTIVYPKESEIADMYGRILRVPQRVEPNMLDMEWTGIPKVLFIVAPERVSEVLADCTKRFGNLVQIAMSGETFIEFNKKDVHKASGVAWIAKKLKITRSEVITMGDNTLDLEMIQWAGLGVAVSNACDILKKTADVIAPACGEDAVKWVIDRFIFGRNNWR